MTKKVSSKEQRAAWRKFRLAGFTERQEKIIKDDILGRAINDAEASSECLQRGGQRVRRIMPQWRLRQETPENAINRCVYWYHFHHRHFWSYSEETGKTGQYIYPSR